MTIQEQAEKYAADHKPTRKEIINWVGSLIDPARKKRVISLIRIDVIYIDNDYPVQCDKPRKPF